MTATPYADAGRQIIETTWLQQWVDSLGAALTPTEFDNVTLDVDALTPVNSQPAPWARLNIAAVDEQQLTLGPIGGGNVHYRTTGLINIQIFTPLTTGGGPAMRLADQAATIYRQKQIPPVTCFQALIRNIGSEGRYWQVNVSVKYWLDVFL